MILLVPIIRGDAIARVLWRQHHLKEALASSLCRLNFLIFLVGLLERDSLQGQPSYSCWSILQYWKSSSEHHCQNTLSCVQKCVKGWMYAFKKTVDTSSIYCERAFFRYTMVGITLSLPLSPIPPQQTTQSRGWELLSHTAFTIFCWLVRSSSAKTVSLYLMSLRTTVIEKFNK